MKQRTLLHLPSTSRLNMAPLATVGIISIGEMGMGIAKLLIAHDYRVVTNVVGRRYAKIRTVTRLASILINYICLYNYLFRYICDILLKGSKVMTQISRAAQSWLLESSCDIEPPPLLRCTLQDHISSRFYIPDELTIFKVRIRTLGQRRPISRHSPRMSPSWKQQTTSYLLSHHEMRLQPRSA